MLLVETTTERDWCRDCGARARSNGRPRVRVQDLLVGGRPTVLVWKKREWRCRESACPAGTWREQSGEIRPRAVLTERARRRAVRRVGRDGTSVAQVARDLGAAWHTINDTVLELCEQMIDGDDRLEGVEAIGVDEHNVPRGTFDSPTVWGTAIVDLDRGRLLDVVPQPTSAAVSGWFAARGQGWCGRVRQAGLDHLRGLRHRPASGAAQRHPRRGPLPPGAAWQPGRRPAAPPRPRPHP